MTTALVFGSDESHYQAASLAFAQSRKAAGDRFAIIKATDGTSTDQTSDEHHAAFGQVGLPRGAYHFYRSHLDPHAQAAKLLGRMAEVGAWELPPTCDFENASLDDNPNDLLAFLEAVEKAIGRTPILYVNGPWWRETIGNDERFARFPLWLAAYPARYNNAAAVPAEITATPPAPWTKVSIWQFSDSAGRLDRDVMTAATLAALTGHDKPAAPPKWTPPPFPGPLHEGMDGAAVAQLKVLLTFDGYGKDLDLSPAGVTKFRNGTTAAVKRAQDAMFLNSHDKTSERTGQVGPRTWGWLVDVARLRHAKAGR